MNFREHCSLKTEYANMDTVFVNYLYLLILILGLVMGSFLNCCAFRLCKGDSILNGRSKCDHCGHVLEPRDLIPVVSYFLQHGKCRYCGKKLDIRYPISEIITAVVYLLVFTKYGFSIQCIERIILWSIGLCISFADLEDCLIPDMLIVLGIVNRVVFIIIGNGFSSELLNSLITGLSISFPLWLLVTVMEKIRRKDLMGGGDIKLLFMLGLYSSIAENFFALFIACVIGIIFGYLFNKGDSGKAFPFGPSIVLAWFLVSMYGNGLIMWYLNLL